MGRKRAVGPSSPRTEHRRQVQRLRQQRFRATRPRSPGHPFFLSQESQLIHERLVERPYETDRDRPAAITPTQLGLNLSRQLRLDPDEVDRDLESASFYEINTRFQENLRPDSPSPTLSEEEVLEAGPSSIPRGPYGLDTLDTADLPSHTLTHQGQHPVPRGRQAGQASIRDLFLRPPPPRPSSQTRGLALRETPLPTTQLRRTTSDIRSLFTKAGSSGRVPRTPSRPSFSSISDVLSSVTRASSSGPARETTSQSLDYTHDSSPSTSAQDSALGQGPRSLPRPSFSPFSDPARTATPARSSSQAPQSTSRPSFSPISDLLPTTTPDRSTDEISETLSQQSSSPPIFDITRFFRPGLVQNQAHLVPEYEIPTQRLDDQVVTPRSIPSHLTRQTASRPSSAHSTVSAPASVPEDETLQLEIALELSRQEDDAENWLPAVPDSDSPQPVWEQHPTRLSSPREAGFETGEPSHPHIPQDEQSQLEMALQLSRQEYDAENWLPAISGADPPALSPLQSLPRSSTPHIAGQATGPPDGGPSDDDSGEGDDTSDETDTDSDEDSDIHTDEDSDAAEIRQCQKEVAEKLIQQLVDGFHGCDEDQHAQWLESHNERVNGQQHSPLSVIMDEPGFYSVLGLPRIATHQDLQNQVPGAVDPTVWRSLFCGISATTDAPVEPLSAGITPTSPPRQHLCLHSEETKDVPLSISYDIDSYLGFAHNLTFARHGIMVQPVPLFTQNITADNHIRIPIVPEPQQEHPGDGTPPPIPPQQAQLRHIPHFYLGRLCGADSVSVHLVFPHLPVSHTGKFEALTELQLIQWLDQIFLPALHETLPSHYTQHLPASYQHAKANSKAHQTENRTANSASYEARKNLSFPIQPSYLDELWQRILQRINQAGLLHFREPEIFFSARGTKLQFKSDTEQPTLLATLESFEEYLSTTTNIAHVALDRFYVDIGKETCAVDHHIANQLALDAAAELEPQTYLYKRCCLESMVKWLYNGDPPSKGGEGQRYYDIAMLHDTASLTSVPPKRSKLYRAGVVYYQWYPSQKEMFDAAKCMPFENEALEELALNQEVRSAAYRQLGGQPRDINIVRNAYVASKNRADEALTSSRTKSFGIREEVRGVWSLVKMKMRCLRRRRRRGQAVHPVPRTAAPPHVWAVRTEVFTGFLWRGINKYAAGFEVARLRWRHIGWAQTKIMAMFLRCMRFVLAGSQMSRESALWWDHRSRVIGEENEDDALNDRREYIGLGFERTYPYYGFCWHLLRVNWTTFLFHTEYTEEMFFGNRALRDRYLRHGGRVRDFFDATRQLEFAFELLRAHGEIAAVRRKLVDQISHLIIRQYRIDVFASKISGEIKAELREEAQQQPEPFTYAYLSGIMQDPHLHLIAGNKDKKLRQDITYIFRLLFGLDQDHRREHWDTLPYRALLRYAKACTIDLAAERVPWRRIDEQVQANFYRFHWIIPWPAPNSITQTTKADLGTRRLWYSICSTTHEDDEISPRAGVGEWMYAGKDWERREALPLPEYLTWSKTQWKEWVAERAQMAAMAGVGT